MDSLFVTKNGALVGCIECFSEKIFILQVHIRNRSLH